ncbi:MAG: hypothetical protein CEO22_566 [Candidatus Berkelbacteria bacterium Gr01-1014_85]|uniref:Uncharacterized protein n=1 Tax=Candidatus Berkelbacteria bacterium Gr01-1014_85 TaxID=2017150 RepID=A0A554JA38_9BACT|nr:MAG: hypothetical protein CEO22_566 [Candidatus Berkelbacteria bacterium Gr01-1014_85]
MAKTRLASPGIRVNVVQSPGTDSDRFTLLILIFWMVAASTICILRPTSSALELLTYLFLAAVPTICVASIRELVDRCVRSTVNE